MSQLFWFFVYWGEGMSTKVLPNKRRLYRVRFFDQSERKIVEVLVERVEPSDLAGLVLLQGFVFRDQTKLVILPEEDEARQRFSKTHKLHIPYHAISFVEEFEDAPADIHKLPFVRKVEEKELKSGSSHITATLPIKSK